MKSVCIRSFCVSYFPGFELNTERYFLSIHIQSECGEIRARKAPNADIFHAMTVLENTKVCTYFQRGCLHFFYKRQASTLKIAYIFKAFRAQSSLWSLSARNATILRIQDRVSSRAINNNKSSYKAACHCDKPICYLSWTKDFWRKRKTFFNFNYFVIYFRFFWHFLFKK